jgi:hypothetical protein
MGMAEFYAPHQRVSSVTDAGGRLLGWTDASGNALRRVGRGVTPAGGGVNVFEPADAPARPAGTAAPTTSAAQASAPEADRNADAFERKPRAAAQRDRDLVRAQILRDNPARKRERWARELMARHPSWFA